MQKLADLPYLYLINKILALQSLVMVWSYSCYSLINYVYRNAR